MESRYVVDSQLIRLLAKETLAALGWQGRAFPYVLTSAPLTQMHSCRLFEYAPIFIAGLAGVRGVLLILIDMSP